MTPVRRGLLAVAAREVRWILRDPTARFLLFGVPVIAFVLLGLTFSRAVVRGLDVVVADMDNSVTSRLFIQTLAASPGITVAERSNDLGAAASAIRAGRAIAALYLPPDFGKDLLSGRAPRPVAFANTQYFTPGNNAAKSLRDAMSAASAAVHYKKVTADATLRGRPSRARASADRRSCASLARVIRGHHSAPVRAGVSRIRGASGSRGRSFRRWSRRRYRFDRTTARP